MMTVSSGNNHSEALRMLDLWSWLRSYLNQDFQTMRTATGAMVNNFQQTHVADPFRNLVYGPVGRCGLAVRR